MFAYREVGFAILCYEFTMLFQARLKFALTLKAPITTAADDNFFFFFFFFFFFRENVLTFHVNCLLGMKCQDLFSLKNKKINFECRLLQILLGALRVKGASLCMVCKISDYDVLLSDLRK